MLTELNKKMSDDNKMDNKIDKLKAFVRTLDMGEIVWLDGYITSAIDNYNRDSAIEKASSNINQSIEVKDDVNTATVNNNVKQAITVFFATETGNAKQVAKQVAAHLKSNNFTVKTQDVELYKTAKLAKEEKAIFIVSTQGEGEFPETAKEFYEFLNTENPDLKKLQYAVIALGDSSYPLFCQAGKDLDKKLSELGGQEIIPRIDFDVDYNDSLVSWINDSVGHFGNSKEEAVTVEAVVNKDAPKVNSKTIYEGEISANVNLSDIGSEVEIRHIEITTDEIVAYQPGDSVSITLNADDKMVQEIKTVSGKIAPRLYSISSSPDYHEEGIHITVRVVNYQDENGVEQKGLCSNYLALLEEGTKIKFSIKPNLNFKLPAGDKDIIMVGPGTGIAPFRSFLAQRAANEDSGKNWLFFGAQRFLSDFLYQAELQEFAEQEVLNKISLAFSRDQEEKIYVQHRMKEDAKELFQWLENGAYFYVCGDKENMAKDVETELLNIISTEGKLNAEESKEYLIKLKEEERYLRDVY